MFKCILSAYIIPFYNSYSTFWGLSCPFQIKHTHANSAKMAEFNILGRTISNRGKWLKLKNN